MLKRPILLLLAVSACGEQALDPIVAPVSARAINLSGVPREVAIWMDGQVIATGLVDTQPSPPLAISAGTHTFGFSAAGATAPEVAAELVVADRSFNLIALVPGQSGPELRVIAYPVAESGKITVRALNTSNESARVILRPITTAPGTADLVLNLEPGTFGQTDVSGTTIVRIGNNQVVTPTSIVLLTGRAADPTEDFNGLGAFGLGFPVAGDVFTVIFHRSPELVPDIYSF